MATFRFEIFDGETPVGANTLDEADCDTALRSASIALTFFAASRPELQARLSIVLYDSGVGLLGRLKLPGPKPWRQHRTSRQTPLNGYSSPASRAPIS